MLSVRWDASERRTPVAFCTANRGVTGEVVVERDCRCSARTLIQAFVISRPTIYFLVREIPAQFGPDEEKDDVSGSEGRKV